MPMQVTNDERLVPATRDFADRDRHDLRRLGLASHAPNQPPPKLGHFRHQALGQRYNHHDEEDADQKFPVERQAAREVGAGHLDENRADHRTDERATATERHPDQELGAEQETGQLGRHHVGEGGVAETRDRADGPGNDKKQDLDARHRNAEIGAAHLVFLDRDQDPAHVAVHEKPGEHRDQHQKGADDPEPDLVRPVVGGKAGQSTAGAGRATAGEDHLGEHDRQRQRDDGAVERRGAMVEREPAGQRGHCHGAQDSE